MFFSILLHLMHFRSTIMSNMLYLDQAHSLAALHLQLHVPWVITAFNESHPASPPATFAESGNTTSATNRQQIYVMVRCLTFQDTKQLWGRATIAIEVVLLEDWENKNVQVSHLWWHK